MGSTDSLMDMDPNLSGGAFWAEMKHNSSAYWYKPAGSFSVVFYREISF